MNTAAKPNSFLVWVLQRRHLFAATSLSRIPALRDRSTSCAPAAPTVYYRLWERL